MSWVAWFGFAAYGGGWFLFGILVGRRIRARVLNEHIDTALALARAGVEEDTPLRRAQTVQFPDRSSWDQQ
jgi:hypothetical protein